MSENNAGSMMGGFLVGALVGAGLALMFAPMAGNETRRRIGSAARKLNDETRDRVDQARGVIKEGVADVGAAIDAGRDAFRHNDEMTSRRESS